MGYRYCKITHKTSEKDSCNLCGISKYKGGIDKLVLSGKMLGKLNIVVESFNSWEINNNINKTSFIKGGSEHLCGKVEQLGDNNINNTSLSRETINICVESMNSWEINNNINNASFINIKKLEWIRVMITYACSNPES